MSQESNKFIEDCRRERAKLAATVETLKLSISPRSPRDMMGAQINATTAQRIQNCLRSIAEFDLIIAEAERDDH